MRTSLDGLYADTTAVCAVDVSASASIQMPQIAGMRKRAAASVVLDTVHLLMRREPFEA